MNCQTSAEDVIEYFNGAWAWQVLNRFKNSFQGKGIIYEKIWEQSYARYCSSYSKVANWKPEERALASSGKVCEDFSYAVVKGKVHSIEAAAYWSWH